MMAMTKTRFNSKLFITLVHLIRGWFVRWHGFVGGCGRCVWWRAFFLDFGVETVVIGGVLHDPLGAVSLGQAIVSLYRLAVAVLGLAFHIVSARVIHGILEVVRDRRVGGLRRVSLGRRIDRHWRVDRGLVSRCGVLGQSDGCASGKDDQLKQNTVIAEIKFTVPRNERLKNVLSTMSISYILCQRVHRYKISYLCLMTAFRQRKRLRRSNIVYKWNKMM